MATKARYDPTSLFRRNQNIPPAIKPAGQEGRQAVPDQWHRLGILQQLGAAPA
jgi:hypothetical protein